MVEKMKRVHLLMAETDTSESLDELQRLGVVHIEAANLSSDSEISDLGELISGYRKTMVELDVQLSRVIDNLGDSLLMDEVKPLIPEEIHRRTRKLLADRLALTAQADTCRKNMKVLEPWGDFNPATLFELEEQQIHISFHALPMKLFVTTDFADHSIEVIAKDRLMAHFVEIRWLNDETAHQDPMCPELKIPMISRRELENQIEDIELNLQHLDAELTLLATERHILAAEISRLEREKEWKLASLTLRSEADGEIQCLSGYVPLSLLPHLNKGLENHRVVSLYEEPESTVETPIRLKNTPLAALFEPITKIFGLPQYTEIDTTPFLAPFFALFFGLCLADVGYGTILTLGTLFVFILHKKKAVKSLSALGFILGIMTIGGGLLLNTLFGMKINRLPQLPTWVASLLLFQNMNDVMAFSIMLGVIQILFGFVLQTVNRGRRFGILGAMQPVGTFLLIVGITIWVLGLIRPVLTIGPLPVGYWMTLLGNTQSTGLTTAAIGVLLILLFNNPAKKIWMRPLLGLWEMYGIATGVPGDILSYIRLFALSLSGGMLGGAINLIATMIRGDNPGILSWFFMLLVLILGHAINFALAALGAFVHPLRLTFVEFYKSVGFSGGGISYTPFGGKTT